MPQSSPTCKGGNEQFAKLSQRFTQLTSEWVFSQSSLKLFLLFCWYFYLRFYSFYTLLPKKRKQSIKSRLHGLPDFVKIYFAMRAYCQLLLQT